MREYFVPFFLLVNTSVYETRGVFNIKPHLPLIEESLILHIHIVDHGAQNI